MKPTKVPSLKSLLERVTGYAQKLRPYRLALFIVFVALLYGFVLLRINTLSNAQPSDDAVSSQAGASRSLHIDPSVVQQLQSLQDNSVSVHTLFDQARNNPFQ